MRGQYIIYAGFSLAILSYDVIIGGGTFIIFDKIFKFSSLWPRSKYNSPRQAKGIQPAYYFNNRKFNNKIVANMRLTLLIFQPSIDKSVQIYNKKYQGQKETYYNTIFETRLESKCY